MQLIDRRWIHGLLLAARITRKSRQGEGDQRTGKLEGGSGKHVSCILTAPGAWRRTSTSRSVHRRAAQAAIPTTFPYALMCGYVIAKSGCDDEARRSSTRHCVRQEWGLGTLGTHVRRREILSTSFFVPSFSSFPSFWSVTRSVCSATQAPTHPSGALVRPNPGSGSSVCVYELANQSRDGKCRI